MNNSSSEPVSVIDQLDPSYGVVNFYITGENHREDLFRPVVVADSTIHTSSLDPDKSIRQFVKIFYGGEGWTFRSGGKYPIRSTYKGIMSHSEEISSNIAEIEVLSPRNKQERAD
ncbi:MAG TPA: hypothetical protein VIW25_07415 [Nitrososphaeraceae archaeon]